MCACSCFHWALFVSFHLKHTSDLTWAVPSWNDTTGKLKDLSTLKKSNAFHSDKHIRRSAALLREMEKWSPLLPLILCITSCLSPSSLLKASFTAESSLVLGGAMMMHWGTCIWKVTCRVWFSFFFLISPQFLVMATFWTCPPVLQLSVHPEQTQQSLLAVLDCRLSLPSSPLCTTAKVLSYYLFWKFLETRNCLLALDYFNLSLWQNHVFYLHFQIQRWLQREEYLSSSGLFTQLWMKLRQNSSSG